ncbi:MAG: hypothetical protein LQ341_006092 [Variospora aurantia]|nr:MAG: hypothetical protein LQ341_006092 [Variospora aurantia]
MAPLSSVLFDTLSQSLALQITVALVALFAYPTFQAIYNLYFHPLSKFPGPKLWAASRLPFIYCMFTGTLVKREREIHQKYGEIVRLAPDEVSFANEQAWTDIYTARRGHKRTKRDRAYYLAPNDQADNIITTNDAKFHLRARTLLSNSFTEDALRAQHTLINGHADTMVSQIHALVGQDRSGKGAMVNMTDWLNFFTMDVIGDLAFGESFGCLKSGEYHSWVRTLFSYLKGMSLAAAPRYYPTTEFLFEKLIPKSVIEGQRRHTEYAHAKINRRLDMKTDRPDFVTPFMKNNANYEVMSRDEILATFNFIIVGGSETTATALTGVFNHLTKKENHRIMARLCEEIRTTFKNEEDITIDATKDLPYLEAVINEGLRLCNPIPGGLPRVVPEGGDTYCGVHLPGGTRLAVRTFAVNRSRQLFANPDRFVPERWLPKGQRPAEYDNDHLPASKPFSVGFHSCMGRPLAWVELRLVVTRMLWAFDFSDEASERVEFDDFPVIMLIQKLPMNVRVRARKGVQYQAELVG